MPLMLSQLSDALKRSRTNPNVTPQQAANEYVDAITQFWETGMGPAGASVSSQACKAVMLPMIQLAFSGFSPSPSVSAQQVAAALDASEKLLILTGVA